MMSKESVALGQVALEGGNGSTGNCLVLTRKSSRCLVTDCMFGGVETAVTLVLCLGLLTWGCNLSGNIAILGLWFSS